MRYYLRFMLVAAGCGAFAMIYYIFPDKTISSAQLIDILGMVNIIDVPTYLRHITFLYGSMVFFEIFFGTYIYRHFCTANYYFFSRKNNRIKWFLCECIKLYGYAFGYILAQIIGAGIFAVFARLVYYDPLMWRECFFYIMIYSAHLMAVTLLINVISILTNSTVAFTVVELIIMGQIAAYSMSFRLFGIGEGEFKALKYNPFAYMVFWVQQEYNRYVQGIVIYLVLVILVAMAGCIVVSRHDFIQSNNETEGF